MELSSPYCINEKHKLLEIINYMEENLRGVRLDEIIKRVNVSDKIIIRRDSDRSIILFHRPDQRYPIKIYYIEKGKGILLEIDVGQLGSRTIVKYEGYINGFVALEDRASLSDRIIIYEVLLKMGIDPERYLKCVKEGEFKEINPYEILRRLKELVK